jgi:hypothetical protein
MSVSRCCQRSRKLCQCHNGANLHQRYWDKVRDEIGAGARSCWVNSHGLIAQG